MKILVKTEIIRTIFTMTVRRKLSIKITIFILLCVCAFVPFVFNWFYITNTTHPAYSELDQVDVGIKVHYTNVETFYRSRQEWPTSTLGGILFKREEIPFPNANRTFTVLVWKYWDWLKNRHVKNFGKASLWPDMKLPPTPPPEPEPEPELEPLPPPKGKNGKGKGKGKLSTRYIYNCEDKLMATADAVLIHLQQGLVPEVKNRNPIQRWIFLNDESPKNAFSLAKVKKNLTQFYDIFNWSMTYRSDADVPVPYGRTLPLDEPLLTSLYLPEVASIVPNWEKKIIDVPATVLMSNCAVKPRNDFLNKLRKHLKVDVYGKCSEKPENRNSCPGHFKSDCETVAKYKFYLVLENTKCFQYLTEKIFYHAYSKGAVPVIWGPSIEDVEALLPPNSYIYVNENTDVERLAKTILAVAESDELLLSLHMWRNNFKVVNEHGYFGSKSYHLCRLCEALNYNDETEKIYGKGNLDQFLDPTITCRA